MAQQSRTLFLMHDIPQSSYVNPAIQPQCRIFVGFPALTSHYFNFSSTALSYSDFTADHTQIDLREIPDKLKLVNYVTAETHLNLISLGYVYNDFYFSFNIAEKLTAQAFYPKQLAELAVNGNDSFVGKTIVTRGLGASAYHLREYSFGVAQDVDWNYQWGLRGKLLFGKANLSSQSSGLRFTTERDSYDLMAEWAYQINTSFPLIIPQVDGEVQLDNVELQDINPLKYLFNPKNMGFALDAGFVYKTETITWLGSVLDFGILRWKTDVNSFLSNGNFSYEGVTVNDSFNSDEFIETMTDSISNQLNVQLEPDGSYFTFLPTKINLGLSYEFHPKANAGLLFRTEFYPRGAAPSLTLSINTVQLDHFVGSFSYSVMNGAYNNFGLGIGFGGQNFMFHAVSDNLLAFFSPQKAHTANIRFGMHFLFGCNQKQRGFKYSGSGCAGILPD
ncbi:MAG: DUF5723 family protein [Bacteroidales bacterium]